MLIGMEARRRAKFAIDGCCVREYLLREERSEMRKTLTRAFHAMRDSRFRQAESFKARENSRGNRTCRVRKLALS